MRRRGLPPAQPQPAGARAGGPCRNGIDRIAMAAHPARLAGSTSRHWLAPAAEMADLASGNWPLSPDLAPMGWTLPRIATRTPGADAGSVRAARDFTIATLQRWGVTERCEDIAIVVSELLTNALQHARPGSGGTRPRWPPRLAPVPQTPGPLAETGRGLPIICALSDKWGCTTPGDTGKVVWAMFSTQLKPPPPGPHPLARNASGPVRERVQGTTQ